MHKLLTVAVLLSFLISTTSGCSGRRSEADVLWDKQTAVDSLIRSMTLREKLCRMFVIRPETLLDTVHDWSKDNEFACLKLDSTMVSNFNRFPAGGICLFSKNIKDSSQLRSFTAELQSLDPYLLLCVDEEGGRVARVANCKNFHLRRVADMTAFAMNNVPDSIYVFANYLGRYLKEYGFDADFAPVADVYTDSDNVVMKGRALGINPDSVACRVGRYVKGLRDAGILSCLKHYPGHGGVKGDTHTGSVVLDKSWEQILECEMIPFKAGIEAGAPFVMVAHISVPQVTGDDTPATLSPKLLTDKLRNELGYDGIIITDGLEMEAVSACYSPDSVAVKAVMAGVDMLLLPVNSPTTVNALVNAVESGQIKESRIDESVRRILMLK